MITIDLGDDRGSLLPGETVLWTGGPVDGRLSLTEAGVALYFLFGVAVFASFLAGAAHGMPGIEVATDVLVVAAVAIRIAAGWITTRVARRRETYQVTSWRLLVTSGGRKRRTWSAYLDQLAEPTAGRSRDNSADLTFELLGAPMSRRTAWAFSRSPFVIDDGIEVPVLRSVRDPVNVAQVIAIARSEMLAGHVGSPPTQAVASRVAVPGAIRIEEGEQVLWAGRPASIPWWFGLRDLYLSVVGLVFLAVFGQLGAWVPTLSPVWLTWFIAVALAVGGYPSVGRLLVRRLRIARSTYVVTDRRIIATWRLARGPIVLHASLAYLMPPELRGGSLIMRPAAMPAAASGRGWDRATWPVTAAGPPSLIGLADPSAVRNLICAAQLASRTRPAATP